MALDNTVTITGNMTRDAELRYTPSGAAVANFGLAVNRRWQNKQTQEWEEKVSFVDVTVWQQLAENVSKSAYKGDRVTVTGRLEQETWEDKDSGKERSKLVLVADEVALSLRWITVPQIVKNEKSEGGRPSGGGRPAAQGGRPQAAQGGGGFDYPEEEPF